jgi:hypothetical protein
MTKVYPTKASALNCHHPIAGAPRIEGTDWPDDVFTFRRLADGSFTEDPAKAYKPPAAAVSEKPADMPAPEKSAPTPAASLAARPDAASDKSDVKAK